MIYALSVQDFVDNIGAYVGFAAAIGLALFALLLFSQARELKRLREWGVQTHDRIGELERRLAAALELARRASSSQRATAPAARPAAVAQRPAMAGPPGAAPGARAGAPVIARTSSPTRLPLLPAAPVGVAASALGSATVLVALPKHPPASAPVPAPSSPDTSAPVSAPAVAPPAPAAIPAAAMSATAAATPTAAAPAPATAAAQGPAQPARPAPAPAPAPPGTNGHSDTFPPVPPVRRPPPTARARAGRRPVARPAARPGQRPAPAAPLRARSAPSATPRGTGNENDRPEAPHGHRRLTLLLVGLGIAAVAAVAAIALFRGGSDAPPAASSGTSAQTTSGSGGATPGAAPAHGRITVAVLNGTTTQGLARTVASELTAAGFVQGAVTNASDQERSVTVVSYLGGREREAQEVARSLGVPPEAVGPIDADTETACAQGGGGTCAATVVVTVGADRQ